MSKTNEQPDVARDNPACLSHSDQGTQNLENFKPEFRIGPTICGFCVCVILVLGLAKWIYQDEPLRVKVEPLTLSKERAWPKVTLKTEPKLYLNVEGPAVTSFLPYIERALKEHGFKLVSTPSKADGIVQIGIFYLGLADLERCRLAVSKGYAAKVNLQGKNCFAFLCDLLVVEREIAKERNEQQTNLATISNRHIKGSVRERVGVVLPGLALTGLPQALALGCADELTKIVLAKFALKSSKH